MPIGRKMVTDKMHFGAPFNKAPGKKLLKKTYPHPTP
jgi:hypothetical protein